MNSPFFVSNRVLKIVFIIILSLLLRLVFSLFIDVDGIGDINGLGDQVFYLEGAKNIFDSGSYSVNGSLTYFRAPLYSYFISIFYSSNSSVWAQNIFVVQTLLTYLSSLLFSLAVSRGTELRLHCFGLRGFAPHFLLSRTDWFFKNHYILPS